MNSVTESGQGFDSISLIMSMVETAQPHQIQCENNRVQLHQKLNEMNKRFLFPRISNTEF